MKKIKVEVTAADIKKARKLQGGAGNICEICPVALALQRATKDSAL